MTTGIDIINAKILKELLKDGRKSFAEIAKECNTSKDVIAKRYKQMKGKSIIVGSTIENSPACYGYNIVAAVAIFTQPNKADDVLELAKKIPQVFAVYHVGINPSLFAIVLLKKIQELDQVKQSIKNLPFILGLDTEVWTDIRNMHENLSALTTKTKAEEHRQKNRIENTEKTLTKLDEMDYAIIEKLGKDARVPFSKIAKELEVSTDTIIRRYERLKQNGELKVTIQIDPTKLGYYTYATFNIAFISKDSLRDRIEALTMIPDITLIIKTSGSFDYSIILMVRDIQELTDVQEKIARMPGVTKLELSVEKMFGIWPLPREFTSTF